MKPIAPLRNCLLIIPVLLVITARRLPAPIQEIQGTPTPLPQRLMTPIATNSGAITERQTSVPLPIAQITASSELKIADRRIFAPQLAFDGNVNTAWCAPTDGIGEWIMARFKAPTILKGVSIYGGHGIDSPRYQASNRVQTLRVSFSDGTDVTLQLEDKMELQHFDFPRAIQTQWAKLEILRVYRGTKYDHTPISEVQFNYAQKPSPDIH